MFSAFLNPSLLLGAGLAAVPIVLHLIMRQKPKQMQFPALRLIKKREDVNRRRLRLRHLILLALRVAAICLLALSLARPSVKLAGDVLGSREAPVAAALVFDTSPRMQYRHMNLTRLEAAKQMSLWLLGQLPEGSDVAVFDTRRTGPRSGADDDEAAVEPAAFSVDRGAAEQRLENLALAAANDRFSDVVERALELLARSERQRKELYLFTDLSSEAWEDVSPERLEQRLAGLGDVGLYLIDVGIEDPQNFALDDLRPSSQVLYEGGSLRLETNLLHDGPGGSRVVELWLKHRAPENPSGWREEKRAETTVEVAADGQDSVEFPIGVLEPGTQQGYVRIVGADGLEWDDTRYFTVEVVPPWRVLIAAPEPADYYAHFLREALAPKRRRTEGRARFACDVASLERLNEPLDEYSAVFVLDPTPLGPDAWRELAAFATRGGGVALVLGGNATRRDFNEEDAQALLAGALEYKAGPFRDDSLYLTTSESEHPILDVFARWSTPWDAFPVRQYWLLAKPYNEGTRVLMNYSNNTPALLERRVGEGHVLTMTTPISERVADPKAWNELTGFESWPFFVLSNEMALYLVGSSDTRLNYAVGEPATLPLRPGQEIDQYVLHTPAGGVHARSFARPLERIVEPSTSQPGNYRVVLTGAELDRGFSVNFAPQSTELTRIDPALLIEAFGDYPPRIARTPDEFQREVGTARVGRELFPYLIMLVAVVLALEHVIANRFYRDTA